MIDDKMDIGRDKLFFYKKKKKKTYQEMILEVELEEFKENYEISLRIQKTDKPSE